MNNKKTVFSICLCPILAGIMFISQVVLAPLANIEMVSFLVIVFSLSLKKSVSFPTIYIFVLLEGLLYGFGVWWFSYLYVWALLALFCVLCKKNRNVFFWSFSSAVFGMLFGLLFTIPYFFMYGPTYAITWWIAGLKYDAIHMIGNFAICLLLFKPIMYAMEFAKKSVRKYI